MSVLAREIDAYKRAVEQYNRKLQRYNKGIDAYNNTIVMDSSGNAVVRDTAGNTYVVDKEGKLSGYTLPQGQTAANYGVSAIPGENRFQLMRQNPTERRTETAANVIRQEAADGNGAQYVIEDSGQLLGPEWRLVSEQGPTTEGGNPTYTFERDVSVYPDKPGDFTAKLRAQQPDPSMAQVRRMFTGSLADRERGGLISDVIRSRGLQAGGTPTQYRSGAVITNPDQPAPPSGDVPIDPTYQPENVTGY
ncbi:hypothetical protein EBZ39_05320 [bacterium]|nr:hypothetical protein [bacterium]